jgi:hypothetical protein
MCTSVGSGRCILRAPGSTLQHGCGTNAARRELRRSKIASDLERTTGFEPATPTLARCADVLVKDAITPLTSANVPENYRLIAVGLEPLTDHRRTMRAATRIFTLPFAAMAHWLCGYPFTARGARTRLERLARESRVH